MGGNFLEYAGSLNWNDLPVARTSWWPHPHRAQLITRGSAQGDGYLPRFLAAVCAFGLSAA
jgi:hypothetical protein